MWQLPSVASLLSVSSPRWGIHILIPSVPHIGSPFPESKTENKSPLATGYYFSISFS
jgi:hypothetical protein